jgi:8-oxo-dGTP pyrophosphatase MutT (NUDIX family)
MKKPILKEEKIIALGGRGRLRSLTYAFENGDSLAYDMFDVRKTMQGSAGVVALDEDGFIYLVKEFLPGHGDFGLSIPRGGIEIEETPLAAAQRELREEAGLFCENMTPLWEGVVVPNASSWCVSLFLGKGVKHVERYGGDEVGGVETIKMPLDVAYHKVKIGEISGALTGLAILLAREHVA